MGNGSFRFGVCVDWTPNRILHYFKQPASEARYVTRWCGFNLKESAVNFLSPNFLALLRRFRLQMVGILFFITLENVAWVMEPGIFGYVIDALFQPDGTRGTLFGVPSSAGNRADGLSAAVWIPLALWIGLYLFNTLAGVLRRIAEQKVFRKMFAALAADVSRLSQTEGWTLSKTAARVQLSNEYIVFLERRVPEILEQSLTIAGTLIALALYDWRIAVACLVIVLPLVAINRLYNRYVGQHQRTLHDRYEHLYDIIGSKNPQEIEAYYLELGRSHQSIAAWGAVNFGAMRVVLLGIFLTVLYIAIDLNGFTTGEIYSIVAYLWTFISSSEYIPDLMESRASLLDISRRLRAAESESVSTPAPTEAQPSL